MHNSPKVAAILVGGKGTRLRSIVSDVPKPLAPVAGEPFLFIILRQLASIGISRVILLTGYLHEQIQVACGDGHQFGLEVIYSEEKSALGTGGALLQAKPYLENNADFILMNGDTYLDCPLNHFLQFPMDANLIGLVGAMRPEITERFSHLEVHPETLLIQHFSAQQTKETAKKGFVNAGIYRLSSAIFDKIPQNQFCSIETDIFPSLIQAGLNLKVFPLAGEFIDIGVPESYKAFTLKMTGRGT